MPITHLGLTVRDPDRSRRFYLDVLGLDGTAYPEPWGFRVDLRDGFMLALIRGEPAGAEPAMRRLRWSRLGKTGCSLPAP
jgi:catechol 2,3-dioxygenase-like lactoylglutathione lyase family enzyme